MKKLFLTLSLFSLLIGVVAIAMNLTIGSETSVFVSKIRHANGFYMYHFSFANYIKNINLSMTEITYLRLDMPQEYFQWIQTSASIVEEEFWEAVGNNLAVSVNYIIYGLNIITYPFRVGAYATKNYFAILGINADVNNINNGLAWLIKTCNFLMQIQIPYIMP